jgi:hypothetical protein
LKAFAVRNFAAGKDIRFGADCRARMLEGVNKVADAVQVSNAILIEKRMISEMCLSARSPWVPRFENRCHVREQVFMELFRFAGKKCDH